MKTRLTASFLLGSALLGSVLPSGKALAQISTNLDALPSTPKASSEEKQAPTTSHKHSTSARHTNHATGKPAEKAEQHSAGKEPASPPGYTTIPAVPAAAPRNVVIAPPFVPVQKHPPVPPEDVKADPSSKSRFITLGETEKRILFDAQSALINQTTFDAITTLAKTLAVQPTKRIRLESYATGVDDDASLPRRVSLERDLIVRSLLILNGVATTRIYPIAHGKPEPSDTNPPDRVDIHIEENPVKATPMQGVMGVPETGTEHVTGHNAP
ncbi:hypothetical protein PT277_07510 [Acetobacteraceae bacterium ESL0709]|nr:hypothetical protein [Acetobacteraceae bacterium ESL0697]MDF7678524.1 hypothetical protein [Acetobacteraceae bacterium ESL0709]